ncbi:MAG: helix-turn-helix domain-containing protein [Tannerella sp.]|jgi:transcriptional regulator with XRE-family HTH domain|nr:helix-turn-helix domain-containing protein [Tannerella sp.]
MKDRIIQIMNAEGLTPSRFAEEIGIQRAAMSHITSGRNNPSLDVVTRILERFPSINPNWLLFGTGDMKANSVKDDSTLFTSGSQPLVNTPDLFANPSNIRPQIEKKTEYRTDSLDKRTSIPPKSTEKEVLIIKESPIRKIEKIMIFYSDNTYEIFNPEKKE